MHIISAESSYKSFIFQTSTCLHEIKVEDIVDFASGDYNQNGKLDLFCFLKNKTGSNKTELHILDGNNNFKSFLEQTPIKMDETNDDFKFLVGDYNRENSIFCIAKRNTGSQSTGIHILDRDKKYNDFILHTKTKLGECGE